MRTTLSLVTAIALFLAAFVTLSQATAEDVVPAAAAYAASDSARIVVTYDIVNAEADAKIYVQHIGGRGDIGTETLGPMKWSPLKNGGKLELKSLAAGDYQVARYRQVQIGQIGMSRVHSGMYLDRRKFKLKDGEAVMIDFARPKSRAIKGRVLGLKESKLEQAVVCVCSENAKDDGSLGGLDVTIFDARLCDKEGAFETEHLTPGKYVIWAQGYEPFTEEDLKFTGIRRPRYVGLAKLNLPETGDAPVVEVTLRDAQAKAGPAKTEEKPGASSSDRPAEKRTARADKPEEDALAHDLKLLQGKWVMMHGNEGKGPPTIRSVKEISGNRETLRRYDAASDKLLHEYSVDFALTTSGSVRVFTFYGVGGDPKHGRSFVYKVDAENFYDVPGLLRGDTYRNYQETPTIWHWKKEKEEKPKAAGAKDDVGKAGGAEKKKPLSPETVFEKGIEGKATVKLLVDDVHTVNIDSLFVPDVSHAQVIKAKVLGAKDDQEFVVTIAREIATRLLRLGIADPAEHFRGKVMQVSGTVERIKRPSTPATTVYRLQVTSLDQLEDIRKP